jgi:hypothetical protein
MMFVFGANGPSGYNLTRSVRLRASASASLTRTFSTPTSQNVFTLSLWIKRGDLSANRTLFCDSAGNDGLRFSSGNIIRLEGNVGISSTAVFRDPSAWYHIVYRQNGTTGTVWINNNSVLTGTVTVSSLNTAASMTLGGIASLGFFDGEMTEINFIDGQALTPSSFGSTNALTGVWQPAPFSGGSYGTNGFYLPFTDNSALTTSSNVGLGKDFSGNGNYWTTNNISITSGVTYDSMTDVPTLTSATAANFAVLNPLDIQNATGTFSNGNLNYSYPSTGGVNVAGVASSIAIPTGTKIYFEVTSTTSSFPLGVGIRKAGTVGTYNEYCGFSAFEYVYLFNGNKKNNNTSTAYGATYTVGDVVGCAVDLVNNQVTFYKNGTSQGVAFTGLSGDYLFIVGTQSGVNTSTGSANFGQQPWAYSPPTGFVSLNTFNLPTSTIVKGNTVMDATTYTGTGASLSVTNTASFKPDLVWVKGRSGATDHALYDSVRGTTKQLESNNTGAETTEATGLTAFGSAGFTVGALAQMNTSAATYVGWQWQAGQGSSSSNTNGSITSTVSVNASAGFSVVTYTGTAVAATIGHSLGVKPSLMILFNRSIVGERPVYSSVIGASNYLYINATNASAAFSGFFNNTEPTSSVFSVGTDSRVNGSGNALVAYCWTPIAGYSAFGSFVGNGSSDGTFVYTGFRPRFVMFKQTNAVSDWQIIDTARSPYNVTNTALFPNLSIAETTAPPTYDRDFLSNGFKMRSTASYINGSGNTFIYMAFAENPLKYALAR